MPRHMHSAGLGNCWLQTPLHIGHLQWSPGRGCAAATASLSSGVRCILTACQSRSAPLALRTVPGTPESAPALPDEPHPAVRPGLEWSKQRQDHLQNLDILATIHPLVMTWQACETAKRGHVDTFALSHKLCELLPSQWRWPIACAELCNMMDGDHFRYRRSSSSQ